MIGVLFPVAHEAAAFIGKLEDRVSFRLGTLPCVVGNLRGQSVVVGTLGMGRSWVERHLPLLLNHFKLERLILSGYGGGLIDDLTHGMVVVAENFCAGGIPPELSNVRGVRGTSSDRVIAACDGKRELGRVTGASVVDMESETVFKIAEARQIPLWVIRAISDTVQDELPAGALAASFDSEKNHPSPFRLMAYLVKHPKEIQPFARFVIGLGKVRTNLTDSLVRVFASGSW